MNATDQMSVIFCHIAIKPPQNLLQIELDVPDLESVIWLNYWKKLNDV